MIELIVLLTFSATLGSGLGLRLREHLRPSRRYSWEPAVSALDVLDEVVRKLPTINRLPPVAPPLTVPTTGYQTFYDAAADYLTVNERRGLSASNTRVYYGTRVTPYQSASNFLSYEPKPWREHRKASVEELFFGKQQ